VHSVKFRRTTDIKVLQTFMSYISTSYTSIYLSNPNILPTPNAIWQQKAETTWMQDDGKLKQNFNSGRGQHNHIYKYIYTTTNDVRQTLKNNTLQHNNYQHHNYDTQYHNNYQHTYIQIRQPNVPLKSDIHIFHVHENTNTNKKHLITSMRKLDFKHLNYMRGSRSTIPLSPSSGT
jgi:hypothetical protein